MHTRWESQINAFQFCNSHSHLMDKEAPVRELKSLSLAVSAMVLVVPGSSSAEMRESYLERLTTICSVRCLPPKDLLRAVRKQKSRAKVDVAVIMDVRSISIWNGKYLLHSNAPADSALDTLRAGPTRRAGPSIDRTRLWSNWIRTPSSTSST